MNILKVFQGTAHEVKLNPNIGTFAWVMHRLTGLLLLLYLFAHLWVLGSINAGPDAFNSRLGMVQTTLFHFLEIGLIFTIFYHMCNGLTITIMDFLDLSSKHKALVTVTVVIFVALCVAATSIMLPRVIMHLMGGGVE